MRLELEKYRKAKHFRALHTPRPGFSCLLSAALVCFAALLLAPQAAFAYHHCEAHLIQTLGPKVNGAARWTIYPNNGNPLLVRSETVLDTNAQLDRLPLPHSNGEFFLLRRSFVSYFQQIIKARIKGDCSLEYYSDEYTTAEIEISASVHAGTGAALNDALSLDVEHEHSYLSYSHQNIPIRRASHAVLAYDYSNNIPSRLVIESNNQELRAWAAGQQVHDLSDWAARRISPNLCTYNVPGQSVTGCDAIPYHDLDIVSPQIAAYLGYNPIPAMRQQNWNALRQAFGNQGGGGIA